MSWEWDEVEVLFGLEKQGGIFPQEDAVAYLNVKNKSIQIQQGG